MTRCSAEAQKMRAGDDRVDRARARERRRGCQTKAGEESTGKASRAANGAAWKKCAEDERTEAGSKWPARQ